MAETTDTIAAEITRSPMNRQRLYYIAMVPIFLFGWLIFLHHTYRAAVQDKWMEIAAPWAGPMPEDAEADKLTQYGSCVFTFNDSTCAETIQDCLKPIAVPVEQLKDKEHLPLTEIASVYRCERPTEKESSRDNGYFPRSYPVLITLKDGSYIYYHESGATRHISDENQPAALSPTFPEYLTYSKQLDLFTLFTDILFIVVLPPLLCIAPRLWFTRQQRCLLSTKTTALCLLLPVALSGVAVATGKLYPDIMSITGNFKACLLCAEWALTLYIITAAIIGIARLARRKS